ncbi:MAG: glycosyltransferase family 4 protein [Pyrinomonadaceae bacterium]
MKILYFANPESIHDAKWINHFAKTETVSVITQTSYEESNSRLTPDIEVFPILPPYSVLNFFKTRRANRELKQFLDVLSPDIVHSMYVVPNAIWAAKHSSDKHVITARGSDLLVQYSVEYANPKGLSQMVSFYFMRRLIKDALRNAAFVTMTSKRLHDVVTGIRGGTGRTAIIRTGVGQSDFSHETRTGDMRRCVVFSPRQMKPIYNVDILVKAFAILIRNGFEGETPVLRIIDDMPDSAYSEEIRDLISQEDLADHVEILPKLDQKGMIANYRDADLVVMIPSSDGTPASAIEAMLMRRSVVVGPLEYDGDIFNDNTVWKTESFGEQSVADTIGHALRDSEERHRKIDNAHAAALRHASLESSLARIAEIYNEMSEREKRDI